MSPATNDIILSMLNLPKGTKVPDHIAVILDGNRRWARSRGLAPWEGHKAGYKAVRKLAEASRELGVHTFTIWSFSTENWDRPKKEIDEIFRLLRRGLEEFKKEAHKEKVRLVHLGRKDRFPEDIARQLSELEAETKKYQDNILNLALDYGGRDEVVRATKRIKNAEEMEDITEENFLQYLDHPELPDFDLIIRTSGEQRTSGFFIWQSVYAELFFIDKYFPDITPTDLDAAVGDYTHRHRRFGA